MQQTANYNLNLPEGTDVVNPLVDYNPNFTVIDGAMKANADRTVGRATCIKSGTTHVVTRSNTGSNIINFTATGDWNEGDTMTIDSTIVSVFLPDGTAVLDGAYLINSEVFGILNGTRFTLYSNITEAETAAKTSYSNASSGLAATDVQGAIDEVASRISAHSYGTAVELVEGVDYTTPSDGYFQVSTSNIYGNNYAYGWVNGVILIAATATASSSYMAAYPNSAIFVRKGAVIKFTKGDNGVGRFYPLQ